MSSFLLKKCLQVYGSCQKYILCNTNIATTVVMVQCYPRCRLTDLWPKINLHAQILAVLIPHSLIPTLNMHIFSQATNEPLAGYIYLHIARMHDRIETGTLEIRMAVDTTNELRIRLSRTSCQVTPQVSVQKN